MLIFNYYIIDLEKGRDVLRLNPAVRSGGYLKKDGHMSLELDTRTVVERAVFSQLLSPSLLLRPLFETEVGTTLGGDTLARAGDVFTGPQYLRDLKNLGLDVPSPKQLVPGTGINVYETIHSDAKCEHNGTHRAIFKSLRRDLEDMRLWQSQINELASVRPQALKTESGGAFFLFTKGDEPVDESADNLYLFRVWSFSQGFSADVRKYTPSQNEKEHVYRGVYGFRFFVRSPELSF